MSIFSSRNIKTAVSRRSKIDLSSRVITTNDFGFILPIFAREAVPGDRFNFGNLGSFARLAPLTVPTFAGVRLVNRAFYVRFSSVWRPWNDFYSGREYITGEGTAINPEVPSITNDEIVEQLIRYSEQTTSDTYDYRVKVAGTWFKYNFKKTGRYLFNLLNSLGYKVNFTMDDTTKFSILPLLCYLRVIFDYFLPSKYTNVTEIRKMFDLESDIQPSQLFALLNAYCWHYFDNDYFTASWENPNSPNKKSVVSAQIKDPSDSRVISNGSAITNDDTNFKDGTALTQLNPLDGYPLLSQFGIDSLKKLHDWGLRKGLAGNRYFEGIFAQFGIKLPDVQTRRCSFLGQSSTYVQVSDVMSTAATEEAELGAYAGKGIIYDEGKNFNVDCNDFGYVIVVTCLIPDTGYVQGRNRELMHIDRLDFFNPEFDRLGMQPVRNDELFAMYHNAEDYTNGQAHGGKPNGIFGYTPTYSEYKKGYDLLSGDFIVPHLNTGADSYHSFRIFSPPTGSHSLENSQSFRICNPAYDGNNFDRIFNVTDQTSDAFTLVFNIPCTVYRKMASIRDSFDLDGGDTVTVDPDCQLH